MCVSVLRMNLGLQRGHYSHDVMREEEMFQSSASLMKPKIDFPVDLDMVYLSD